MSTRIGQWAPVALFIYRRPHHARQMITSLQGCAGFADSPVHVFADGPAHPRDLAVVEETRADARRLLGDHAAILERDVNVGLDKSIIAGVTELCERYGRVIVVEDDLVVSPNFLLFMNAALERYEDEQRIMQISGHMFDVPQLRHQDHAIFLPMTTSWAWATWKRAWDRFDPLAEGWRERMRHDEERKRFDLDGHFGYAKMLSQQMRRQAPAWDIRWYYTVFALDGLALFPPRTLVVNIGFDGSGTHDRLSLPVRQAPPATGALFQFPAQVEVSPQRELVFQAVGAFRPASTPRKLIAALRAIFRRAGRR